MSTRKAKLVPWYHVTKDQCEIDTIKGNQCKNSASYMARSGLNGSTEEKPACKPHADILRLDRDRHWRITRIKERFITI
jgi:hypothetical protein